MIPSLSGLNQLRESNPYNNEEAKKPDLHRKKEKPSISKNKLTINIKNNADIKEISRHSQNKKLLFEKHQRSNNEQMPEFDSLIDRDSQEPSLATERYSSSLIENFDQSEFIKNVILQSRKLGGNRFGSPGQTNSSSTTKDHGEQQIKKDKNFIKDMKKHGILKAFNDINKFTEFFQNSPSINQETLEDNTTSYNNYSTGNLDYDSKSASMQNIVDTSNSKNTKSSYILEEMANEQVEEVQGPQKQLKSFKFIFPFQRRARSHSPPKNAVITNKIITALNNPSPNGILAQSSIHKES